MLLRSLNIDMGRSGSFMGVRYERRPRAGGGGGEHRAKRFEKSRPT
jgi:hypothetical protein